MTRARAVGSGQGVEVGAAALYGPDRAIARGRVYMKPETSTLVARGAISKGDVLAVARVAGIQAAKRAPDLIPLCHPLLVGSVFVNFRIFSRRIISA